MKPSATNSIGTNAITMMIGAWNPIPTTAVTAPRVAARLYAGAVEATPITMLETNPSAPAFSPLSSVSE